MNWIKQNPFLSALLGFAIVGVLGLGYLLFTAKGKFAEATASYQSVVDKKAALEKKKPYPTEENAAEFKSMVSSYKSLAGDLSRKMLAYQAPLPVGVSPSNFQESLAQQVDAIVNAAELNGVMLGDGFFLGMDDYRATPPLADAAQRLQFQLDATSRLVNILLDNDATMVSVARERQEWEKRTNRPDPKQKAKSKRGKREAATEEAPVTSEVFPMEIVFAVPSASFQNVINALSNTAGALGAEGDAALKAGEEYFYSIRWMRVENGRSGAPSKGEYEAPPEVDEDEENTNAAADVFADKSLNMIFGAEQIKAYLALDLIRLMAPEDSDE